ncbi:hypothetical protein PFICI_09383 [Pestalotiopsis fici W106-1]|uniref:Uncharacterized protein n=1 Tax=Pestalotiopsis fici (strain W106-1 / CGMCC3.15140) TaxID=1229662 RepID=W3X0A0_PESFW|nr:uncharacterized protein PFICI_09383 [Pestalotiopsis fici W106-1]ETS79530.1 hypothetical protein PFICI_09383 [Pestalotiopsis fici W106-1]
MADNQSCDYLIYHGAVVKPNSDISGIGVILAFVLSAYVTFIAILAAYLFGLVDEELLNEVDRRIFQIHPYRSGTPSSRGPRGRVYRCVRHVIIILSDQQMFTGIAIMSAGFRGLQSREISVYHFQIVLYLAWMSSSVHLSAVTLLGSYLRRHRGMLFWRFAGMLVLLVMLIVALVPTISNDWGIYWWDGMLDGRTGWAIPAYCFWGELWGDGVGPDAPLGFVILAVSYLWKMGALFETTTGAYRSYLKNPIEDAILGSLTYPATKYRDSQISWFWLWIFRLALGIALPTMAIVECASSFAASLWLSLTSLLYGTIQIFVPRGQMIPLTGSSESSWGFGQLVPLILLIQPVGVLFEHLHSQNKSNESQNGDHATGHDTIRDAIEAAPAIPGSQKPSLLEILVNKRDEEFQKGHSRHKAIWKLLYSSKLFAMMVYLVQLAIAAICAVVFYFDALTIGNVRSDNWSFILVALAAFLGAGLVSSIVLAPLSVTGRRPRKMNGELPVVRGNERLLELSHVRT